MKGIELSKAFYKQYGEPMLKNEFPDLMKYIAVGFVGSGSERFGFDDEISYDHDFEVGFSIFLPDESVLDRKKEFALERAYSKLPKEFNGVKRPVLSPVGGNRNGPVRTSDFYYGKVGVKNGEIPLNDWLYIPDYALFEATDGQVFYDGYGEFTSIRNKLLNMPKDAMLKRLAGNLLIMAQSGQYNYMRCINHGEKEGASLALNEFVCATVKCIFLLNGKYAPYYKWMFKALRNIDGESELTEKLSFLLLKEGDCDNVIQKKSGFIEDVCTTVIRKLEKENYTDEVCEDLEKHAYSVNDKIEDGNIRNLNILVSV